MRIRRQFQACGSKRLGPILPDGILDQFSAAVTADDRDAVRALLDTHFPDRTQLFPGQYNIHELFPVISQAARNDQANVLKELFVPYPFPYQSTDFVAREAIDTALTNGRGTWTLRRKSRTQSATQSVAAASDIAEMLGLLLERGAPLNLTLYADDEVSSYKYRNSDHGTPLHEAAQMGHVEAVQYLLAQGADTSIISTRSKTTALAWAEKACHEDVVAMLRSPDHGTEDYILYFFEEMVFTTMK
ncbi:ankyrin repeat protein [Ophiostoma piceae UAMH 11346]|uniref:Ankyrin repeat protein n=1 Tax=Ophiostoma piceae (strain UAMH 11346) TaxID=1262450 RepID=S3BY20_OPHP1|nr:ankyrin repeat protein [Ophiostoma piceae UAMH 11346]